MGFAPVTATIWVGVKIHIPACRIHRTGLPGHRSNVTAAVIPISSPVGTRKRKNHGEIVKLTKITRPVREKQANNISADSKKAKFQTLNRFRTLWKKL